MVATKFELRRKLRAMVTDQQRQRVIHPEKIEDQTEIEFDRLIEQFGSVAYAAIQSGIPYLNTTTNERAIVGDNYREWRVNAVTTTRSLAGAIDSAPDLEAIALHISRDANDVLDAFGSQNAVLREAGIDPVETTETVSIHERTATIRSSARELGSIPSPIYVAHRSGYSIEEVISWFDSWAVAIEASYGTAREPTSLAGETIREYSDTETREKIARIAASQVRIADSIGGYPYPNPETEFIRSIETLAERIDHRPLPREILEYLPYDRADFASTFDDQRPIETAVESASVPSQRDLSPSGSVYRQPETMDDDIPTHTDLLRDIHIVRIRGPNDVFSDFDDRGVLDKRHFEVQYGSFQEAVAAHDELDPSDYRETRTLDWAPILQDTVNELQTVLDRVLTAADTAELTDYDVSNFIEEFDSWTEVVDKKPPLGAWTNRALLDDTEAVGQTVGRPPTPTDIVDGSSFPFTSYIRRFGSLPTVLRNVGVEATQDIPEEYLAVTATRDVWERTEQLVQTSFSVEPAFYDDLWRLYHEFGSAPSYDQYERYGLYDPTLAGTKPDWKQTLKQAGFTDPQTDTELEFDSTTFESDLKSLADSSELPVFPRDVECFTGYSVPSVTVEYGTLEAAFEVVGIETRHLKTPIETPHDVWKEHHERIQSLIEDLRRLDESTHRKVTYTDVRQDQDLSTDWIYYAFDSFSEAAEVAGITDAVGHTPVTSSTDHSQKKPSDGVSDAMVEEVKHPEDESNNSN